MPYDVDIGDGADALGQNQLTDALDGTYWVSGWDATLGTGSLEVDIAAGSGAIDGSGVSTGSTQTIDFTGDPDPTDPRKAAIYVDSGGTVQKSLGTPQPVDPSGEIRFRTYNPSPPASVSGVVVAEVWLAAGETVLESADVRDRRVSNDAVESAGSTPVTQTDEAITFQESDLTVSNNDTTVFGESIELVSNRDGSTADWVDPDSNILAASGEYGILVNPNTDLSGISVLLNGLLIQGDSSEGFTDLRVRRNSDGVVIASKDITNLQGGDRAQIDASMNAGVEYRVVLDNEGGDTDRVRNSQPNYPYQSADIDVTAGISGNSEVTRDLWQFNEITAVLPPASSGSATVSFDAPADIVSWDIATYQATKDGEIVTVNVLDGGGGEVFSDIDRNTDISNISTSENVQIEVELSRSDINNNPTLDYAARRYER